MSWWGKLIGGAFGYALGGPIGALLGAVVGHQFDRGLKLVVSSESGSFGSAPDQERVQTVFFTTVFSVMGHLAKIDGRVSEDEIAMARSVMLQMRLSDEQKQVAIDLFRQGKQPGFTLDEVINQFRHECGRRRNLMMMFMEILLHAGYADGQLKPEEKRLLQHVSARLGFSQMEFAALDGMVRAQRAFHQQGEHARYRRHEPAKPNPNLLQEAYDMLGVTANAGDSEIKRAYRRLMNQHHPDKLVAKGLPEEMVKMATEKTQEIKAAYETICQHRGIK